MSARNQSLQRNRFAVEIDGVVVSGFIRVDLPGRSTEVQEYREGSDSDFQKNVWGQTTYDDLTMVRSVKKNDTALHDWRRAVEAGRVDQGLKDIDVVLQDDTGTEQIRWEFTEAWPKAYVPPTLDAGSAGGQGDVAVEEITVAFDTMTRA